MRGRKASIFTKLAVLALVVYAAVSLIGLHGQIERANEALIELHEALTEQALHNAILENELENRDNPEVIERIARTRFGLLMPGERIFYSVTS